MSQTIQHVRCARHRSPARSTCCNRSTARESNQGRVYTRHLSQNGNKLARAFSLQKRHRHPGQSDQCRCIRVQQSVSVFFCRRGSGQLIVVDLWTSCFNRPLQLDECSRVACHIFIRGGVCTRVLRHDGLYVGTVLLPAAKWWVRVAIYTRIIHTKHSTQQTI